MDDSLDGAYGCDWMLGLPDVSAQVDSDGALLHAVVDEVEDFTLGFSFGSACNDDWHWASVNYFVEVFFAVVCFDYSCADFRDDAGGEC